MNAVIRPAAATQDWEEISKICCETANSGKPISTERWPFFGELWTGPYRELLPNWCLVAEDGNTIIGYLTGCPNTEIFKQGRFWRFDAKLALKVLLRQFTWNTDTKRFLKRLFKVERGPEEMFSRDIKRQLHKEFPAHLHINLREGQRGGGVGRKLMETHFEMLKENRVPGVHLFCGHGPVEFYKRLGFHVLATIEFKPGVLVFAMVRKTAQEF
jgi:GNAT superfamily N-acetyltransferase